MYREQEAEEHSEDEDYEGPGKFDAFERPAFKRRTIKTRAIQWALEDRRDHAQGGGIKYTGDKITQQMSRYATFKVDPNRPQTIEVTPIDEWWQFKKAPKDTGKNMTVKEAEELMKKQENFLGPLSLANRILGKKSLEAAAKEKAEQSRYGGLDHEDTQVLKEAGMKLASPEDTQAVDGFGDGSGSDGGAGEIEKGEVDSDAGGEDDDFGDEVRSDDEEEVGNDDANEGGGTLHQDDEDLNDSDDEHLTDDEHHELQKLSRSVNAEGGHVEEEDDYTVSGDIGRASPTVPPPGNPKPAAGAPAGDGADSSAGGGGGGGGGGGSGKRGASAMEVGGGEGGGSAGGRAGGRAGGTGSGGEGGSGSKRARTAQKKGAQEINQANVVATLKRYGGRLASKALLGHFVAALKADGKKNKEAAVANLRAILKKVATKVDDAIEGTVWVLKKHFS
ncbi:hypothetical protein Esi_0030_0136 [Ectocarpus siliculosus]|uniref:Uncharacterized protein n=1 Tax=Ectocarpus siliculosus TaxID=2880 RepID=D8LKK6_ECTSI|nr:hypothetical protein Esi_0030_0136 [Ectocarpus siliculosus]|eukprot:CBN74596.1 hypothetical protein Esi_0030_0136 [Ectocarpus siliculosus]